MKGKGRLSEEGRKRLQDLVDDPDLLDMRRPAALSTLLVEQTDWEIPEGLVESRALSMRKERAGEGEEEPPLTEAELNRARVGLLQERSLLLESHTSTLASANRAVETSKLLVTLVIPVLNSFAAEVGKLLAKYLPADQQKKFLEELDTAFAVAVATIANKGDKLKGRK